MVVNVAPRIWSRQRTFRRFKLHGAAVIAAIVMSVGLAAQAHGDVHAPAQTVVVQPGDSLWSIASSNYPSDDIRERVEDIVELNHLSSDTVIAGETLQLPD